MRSGRHRHGTLGLFMRIATTFVEREFLSYTWSGPITSLRSFAASFIQYDAAFFVRSGRALLWNYVDDHKTRPVSQASTNPCPILDYDQFAPPVIQPHHILCRCGFFRALRARPDQKKKGRQDGAAL